MSASRESRVLDGKTPSARAVRVVSDSSGPPPGACRVGNLRVILVDDQAISREALRRLLRQEPGIEVVGVLGDASQGLEAIRKLEPDLLFVDVQMPGMDGIELASRLHGGLRPAVVFVTTSPEFAVKAFELGAIDYVLKPCTRERLQRTLQRVRSYLR